MPKNLWDAASSGDLEAAERAIAAGAQLDSMNIASATALMCAVENGYSDIVRLLIRARADLEQRCYTAWISNEVRQRITRTTEMGLVYDQAPDMDCPSDCMRSCLPVCIPVLRSSPYTCVAVVTSQSG